MLQVIDVSTLVLRGGYPTEEFGTLAEAFTFVAEQISDGMATKFEIKIKGGNSYDSIQIDAEDFADALEEV